ncbi:hypothetical protein XHC_1147 [Xanthomonas hortorum pv. carotae str. M081]|nr:hypothetical protein XHC_1147 [Xanthomonas hortorum pv. carotae str. M081]
MCGDLIGELVARVLIHCEYCEASTGRLFSKLLLPCAGIRWRFFSKQPALRMRLFH